MITDIKDNWPKDDNKSSFEDVVLSILYGAATGALIVLMGMLIAALFIF